VRLPLETCERSYLASSTLCTAAAAAAAQLSVIVSVVHTVYRPTVKTARHHGHQSAAAPATSVVYGS